MEVYTQEGESKKIGVVTSSLGDLDPECSMMTSPCIQHKQVPWVHISGTRNVCSAYNYATALLRTDYVAFTHTDVFIPPEWEQQVLNQIQKVDALDQYWGALGPAGVMCKGTGEKMFCGHIKDRSRLLCVEGLPIEVFSLDEVMVIMRGPDVSPWDERMPTYHLSATELCMRLRKEGHRSYAIDAPIRHDSRYDIGILPVEFERSIGYLVANHPNEYIIFTSCTTLVRDRGSWHAI